MELRIGAASIFLLAAFCAAATHAESDKRKVRFELEHGYLVLTTCTLGQTRTFRCVIDTGTDESVIDTQVAKRLALAVQPATATTFNREQAIDSAVLKELDVGPVHVTDLPVLVAELRETLTPASIDVIVGMDVLRHSAFTIDYRRHELDFDKECPPGGRVPLVAGLPFAVVRAGVGGSEVRLKLDTGWMGLLLYHDRLKHVALADKREVAALQTALGQDISVEQAEARDFRVGGLHLDQVPVTLLEHGPKGFDLYDGVLGPRMLKAPQVCFDMRRLVIQFRR